MQERTENLHYSRPAPAADGSGWEEASATMVAMISAAGVSSRDLILVDYSFLVVAVDPAGDVMVCTAVIKRASGLATSIFIWYPSCLLLPGYFTHLAPTLSGLFRNKTPSVFVSACSLDGLTVDLERTLESWTLNLQDK